MCLIITIVYKKENVAPGLASWDYAAVMYTS